MLIGISGFEGSGKNTVADILTKKYQFKQESFAGKLKDILSVLFGWDRAMLEGLTAESRKQRFEVDTWWADRLEIPDLTPKVMLKTIGTDVFRNCFHNEIWVSSLERQLIASTGNIVVTDVRFANEAEAIRRLGGKLLRVRRGAEPEWYKYALIANTHVNEDTSYCLKKLEEYGIHPSETNWIGLDFDAVIENLGSLEYLETQVDQVIHKLK